MTIKFKLTSLILLFSILQIPVEANTITKISVGENQQFANGSSTNPSIDESGNLAVFESFASNLVANDSNGTSDVFYYNHNSGSITRISVDSAGNEANNMSANPVISRDGRYVAYESFASNLVTNDTNNVMDIFVWDNATQTTERVSVDSTGSQANSHSFKPSISADGRFVAYYSVAINLVPGDSNRSLDVFVHDRNLNTTTSVSVNTDGTQANMDSWWPEISADGRFVVFASSASNLDPTDINGQQDIYVHDRNSSTTTLVSKTNENQVGNNVSQSPSISSDGTLVAFTSAATNFDNTDTNQVDDVFVANINSGSISRVNMGLNGEQANDHSRNAKISGDGHYVSFITAADTLVTGDNNLSEDVYVKNLVTSDLVLVSKNASDIPGNSSSNFADVSNEANSVVFSSFANNLVESDSDFIEDIFLSNRAPVNDPPVADAGIDTDLFLGQSVTLDGSGSSDPNNDPLVSYTWTLVSAPDTSLLLGWTSNDIVTSFLPDVEGTYVFSLVVNDGMDDSVPDEKFVNVLVNLPPVSITFSDVTEGFAPLTVNFDGSQSYDPEQGALLFHWEFGDGSTSNEATPSHQYSNPGNYTAKLTVTDDFALSTTSELNITVHSVNRPPVVNVSPTTPLSGPAPLYVNFEVDATDPDDDVLYFFWDFDDGSTSTSQNASHTYLKSGEYKAVLTVNDGEFTVARVFTVVVDSSLTMNVKHAKIKFYNHYKSYSKIRLKTHIDYSEMHEGNANFKVSIGKFVLTNVPLSHFKQWRNRFYYRSNNTFVYFNLDSGNMMYSKTKATLTEQELLANQQLSISIGNSTATELLNLQRKARCKTGDRGGKSKCRVVIYRQ